MVLKMADLGRFRKSFQTPWNASYLLENRFLTTFELVGDDLGWIRKGPKSTDFEQKAWAIAHGFEDGGFGQVSEIAPNSLKRLLFACKWIFNYLRDCSCGFRVNSQWSEIGRIWAKSLGYSPWFWTWRIWAGAENRSKLPETPPICLKIDF